MRPARAGDDFGEGAALRLKGFARLLLKPYADLVYELARVVRKPAKPADGTLKPAPMPRCPAPRV